MHAVRIKIRTIEITTSAIRLFNSGTVSSRIVIIKNAALASVRIHKINLLDQRLFVSVDIDAGVCPGLFPP